MGAILAIALTGLCLAGVALLWRELRQIQQEFFQLKRQRQLHRLGTVASAVASLALVIFLGALFSFQRLARSVESMQVENSRLSAQVVGLRLERDRSRVAVAPAHVQPEVQQVVAQTQAPAIPMPTPAARIGADSAVIRSAPGRDKLFSLTKGTGIRLLGVEQYSEGRGWREIAVSDGRRGWVASSLLERGS